MLNTEICKSDNWRCVVELSSGAGSGGSCTAPGPQHSVCCVMETPAFNYGFKTLISVCVCVCYKPPLVPAPQMRRDVSAPACHGVGSFRVFLSQAGKLWLAGFVSQRGTVSVTPADS